jgi:hypothetical protein
MAMNTLSNYGEQLLLNNLISHDGTAISSAMTPDPHNVLEVALYFEEYTGGGAAITPTGASQGVSGDGLGMEVSGNGYVRQKVWFSPAGTVGGVTSMTNKGTGDSGSIVTGAVSFPTATNDWTVADRGDGQPGTQIKYMAIIDTEAVGGAKVIWYGEVKDSSGVAKTKIVQKDDVIRFAVDSITLSLD